MASYVVGDLQGCLAPLQTLLARVDFNPQVDKLWVAGDMVNRGPQSLETLRFLYRLDNCTEIVLGNHDLHLLAVASGCRQPSPSDTLQAILCAPDRESLLTWLRHQKLLHHDADLGFTMVHAGIPPQWTLAEAQRQAQDVEQALQGDQYLDYLQHLYGNEPAIWAASLSRQQAWRLSTNYLTRMRFCRADGYLDLTTKTGANTAVAKDYRPWFAHPQRKTRQHNIVFGHWAALEGKTNTCNSFAVDTGYVWGGALTLMRLEDQRRFVLQAG
ncbi:MAG: symmetrical bis(5'-nucleosyl)-tetraphosphatase [Cellvibrionaceae bacterium]|nr:symmetrical bis(5'-nucleosyl)-tetraphosphatase [Cellvibrionaceae bacterium]